MDKLLSTLDKKQSKATGWKSEQEDGMLVFLIATINAFFQAGGNSPFFKDSLKSLTRNGPIVGNDLAITL